MVGAETIAAYAGVAAAVVAAVSAIAAWRAASHAKSAVAATLKAAEANLLDGFLVEYHGDAMREALGELRAFNDKYGQDLVGSYQSLHASDHQAWIKVSRARRTVSGYFYRLLALHEGKYVPEGLVKLAAVSTGYSLLIEVVEALEYAHADRNISIFPYVRRKFDALIAICGEADVSRFKMPPALQRELG